MLMYLLRLVDGPYVCCEIRNRAYAIEVGGSLCEGFGGNKGGELSLRSKLGDTISSCQWGR